MPDIGDVANRAMMPVISKAFESSEYKQGYDSANAIVEKIRKGEGGIYPKAIRKVNARFGANAYDPEVIQNLSAEYYKTLVGMTSGISPSRSTRMAVYKDFQRQGLIRAQKPFSIDADAGTTPANDPSGYFKK